MGPAHLIGGLVGTPGSRLPGWLVAYQRVQFNRSSDPSRRRGFASGESVGPLFGLQKEPLSGPTAAAADPVRNRSSFGTHLGMIHSLLACMACMACHVLSCLRVKKC